MNVRFSLLAKIYLSTAVAVTTLLAATGWFFERQASLALHDGVEQEVRHSLGTVDASWQTRAELLSTASALLASTTGVRSAFGTRNTATIRDTAGELWTRAMGERAGAAAFVVADPGGMVMASVGGQPPSALNEGRQLPASLLDPVTRAFPKQSGAFAAWNGIVWQILATPVYVDSGQHAALLNILLAAHPVNLQTLDELKQRTGGSDFLLRAGGQTTLATLDEAAAEQVVAHPERFAIRRTDLADGQGQTMATLWAVRSFDPVEARVTALRRTMVMAWLIAMTVGLSLSYFLARRIVNPVRGLIQAAQQVSREDYSVRVPEDSHDELGVLAGAFNHMSASIEAARAEQVRSGQIMAVGRLAASIAHDLRNPLAAIRGGSEMLAEFDLPPQQMKQTGVQIHSAAMRMEKLLAEIGQVARAQPGRREICAVDDLVREAVESQQARADAQQVAIRWKAEEGAMADCERSRVMRVLINLLANSLEVQPNGGEIAIDVLRAGDAVWIEVSDLGPGIPEEIRGKLFQPFVTSGKKNGLGLGLALARQTMLDHGGDLELVDSPKGARFRLRLPAAQRP